jgi:prohibitin 1
MLFILSLVGALVGAWLWFSLRRAHPGTRTPHAAGVAVLVFLGVAVAQTYTAIPAGHVGIVDSFGRVSQTTLKSGLLLINPLNRVVKMSIQTQKLRVSTEVPCKENLPVALEASVEFRLDPEKAYEIYTNVGDDYVADLVDPEFRTLCGNTTSAYEAAALYTTERANVGMKIKAALRDKLAPRGIEIQDVRLESLTLPKRIATQIEERLKAEGESALVLEKERQDAERRRIEAQGQADAQRILAQGLTEPLLRLRGIEATLKLAQSPNAKVVVVGSGKDGLPVILGGQ